MPLTLGSNIASLKAQRALSESSSTLSTAFERLSSGLRINSAKDDPAGLILASSLRTNSRLFSQSMRNVNDAISALNVADGAITELTNIVMRVKELATEAANGIYSSSQRSALDAEGQALRSEFTRIISTTTFNQRTLLDGTFAGVSIQAGMSSTDTINVSIPNILSTTTGPNGTYGAEVQYGPTNYLSAEIETTDVTGDSITDVILVNTAMTKLDVFAGNGDGTFKTVASYTPTLGSSADDFAVADLDGDGDKDAVIKGASIVAMINNGSGSYTSGVPMALDAWYTTGTVRIGDVNGDGKLDAVSQGSSTVVNVFLGNGNGSFQSRYTFASSQPGSILRTVTDLNGDSKADLVFTNFSGGGWAVVLMGNGNGTFQAANSYLFGSSGAGDIAFADINSDGKVDMVGSGTAVGVLLGVGDGTFKASVTYATSSVSGGDITLADMNSDGRLDVVMTNSGNTIGGGTVHLLLGNGDGTFTAEAVTSLNSGLSFIQDVKASDVNRDGVLDIVVGRGQSASLGEIGILLGQVGTVTSQGLGSFSLLTQLGAQNAMTTADATLTALQNTASAIGSYVSRFDHTLSFLDSSRTALESAYDRIASADIAEEVSAMTRAQILQQAASAILAQANQEPSLVLKLLS